MIGNRLGRWRIEHELGQGGMGRVFLAHEQLDGQPAEAEPRRAALKILSAQLAQEPGFVARFHREIEALRKLQHPHIVQFYEAGEHQGCHYYAMEYIDGEPLDEVLRKRGRLPWEEVLDLALQLCPALKHAHDHGVIHRDIKLSNLILSPNGTVKLTDFGVAKVFATTRLTVTNAVVGTAEYLSPEQAAGKPVTLRSDLYSLGVVLYTLLTGRTPFQASSMMDMLHKHQFARFDPPKEYIPDLPHDFNAIICQLLEKDPEKRPADGLVLGRQLERLRRKLARKDQPTSDYIRPQRTVVEGGGDTEEGDDGEAGPGPATLMSRLMRAEIEALNRAGPLGRLINRGWVLMILLAGVIFLLVWGLWPKPPEEYLRDAEAAYAAGDPDRAVELLDKLDRKHPGHALSEDVKSLRHQIIMDRAHQKARSRAGELSLPASEAERFYREGVHLLAGGQIAAARERWQRLVDAFTGVAAEESWVRLARNALEATANSKADPVAVIDEAIRLAKSDPDKGGRRLEAVRELYRGREEPAVKAALERLAAALRQ